MATVIRLVVLIAVLWLIQEVRSDEQETKVGGSDTIQNPKDNKNSKDFFFSDDTNAFAHSDNPSRGRNVPKTAWSHEDTGAENQRDVTNQGMESKQDKLSFRNVSKLFKYLLSFVYNMDEEEKSALTKALENPDETDAFDELNKKISNSYIKRPSKRYRKLRNTRKRSGCTEVNGTKCNKPGENSDIESKQAIREGNDYRNFKSGNNGDAPFDDEASSDDFFDDDREYVDNFQNTYATHNRDSNFIIIEPIIPVKPEKTDETSAAYAREMISSKEQNPNEKEPYEAKDNSFVQHKIGHSGNAKDNNKLYSEANNKPEKEKEIVSFPLAPNTLEPTPHKDLQPNDQQGSDDPSPTINDSETITQAYNENPNDASSQYAKESFTSSPEDKKKKENPNDAPAQFDKESLTSSPEGTKKEESPNDVPAQFDKESFTSSPDGMKKERSPNEAPPESNKSITASSVDTVKEDGNPNDSPSHVTKEIILSSPSDIKTKENPNDDHYYLDKEGTASSPNDIEKNENPNDSNSHLDTQTTTSSPNDVQGDRNPDDATLQLDKKTSTTSSVDASKDENSNDANKDENSNDVTSPVAKENSTPFLDDVKREENPNDAASEVDKETITFSPSDLEKNKQHKSSTASDPEQEANRGETPVNSVYPGHENSNQFTEENNPEFSSVITTTTESASSHHAEDNPLKDNNRKSLLSTTEASDKLDNFRNSNEEASNSVLPENDGVSDGIYKTFVENGTTKQEKFGTPSNTASQEGVKNDRHESSHESEAFYKKDDENPPTQSELPKETQLVEYSQSSDCEDEDFEDISKAYSTDEYEDVYSLSDFFDEYSDESDHGFELQTSYDHNSEEREPVLGSKQVEQTNNSEYDSENKTDMPLAASPSSNASIQDYYKPEHTFNTILEYIYKYTNHALFKALKEHSNSTFIY
ncbi:probable WRKY transcription factor protein 1 [Stegodyphus dumicola]|uniref:probable WRKY transcription factor protein 1 n=1 Tax=Stegodyphus dumicola TaxID=202533 RepID=UPI0015B305DA|nr:probable WRKY transcription factor protein 1 [Stegodyphus dumicola]